MISPKYIKGKSRSVPYHQGSSLHINGEVPRGIVKGQNHKIIFHTYPQIWLDDKCPFLI